MFVTDVSNNNELIECYNQVCTFCAKYQLHDIVQSPYFAHESMEVPGIASKLRNLLLDWEYTRQANEIENHIAKTYTNCGYAEPQFRFQIQKILNQRGAALNRETLVSALRAIIEHTYPNFVEEFDAKIHQLNFSANLSDELYCEYVERFALNFDTKVNIMKHAFNGFELEKKQLYEIETKRSNLLLINYLNADNSIVNGKLCRSKNLVEDIIELNNYQSFVHHEVFMTRYVVSPVLIYQILFQQV